MKTYRDTGRKDGFQWWSSDVNLTGNINCPEKKELYYQKAVTASVDSVSLSRVLCGCPPHLGTPLSSSLHLYRAPCVSSPSAGPAQDKNKDPSLRNLQLRKASQFGTDCWTEAVLGETFNAVGGSTKRAEVRGFWDERDWEAEEKTHAFII